MSFDAGDIKCEHCDRTIKSHRWGKIKAHDAGWYFQKDGRAFCPDHRPAYAPERKADRSSPSDASG